MQTPGPMTPLFGDEDFDPLDELKQDLSDKLRRSDLAINTRQPPPGSPEAAAAAGGETPAETPVAAETPLTDDGGTPTDSLTRFLNAGQSPKASNDAFTSGGECSCFVEMCCHGASRVGRVLLAFWLSKSWACRRSFKRRVPELHEPYHSGRTSARKISSFNVHAECNSIPFESLTPESDLSLYWVAGWGATFSDSGRSDVPKSVSANFSNSRMTDDDFFDPDEDPLRNMIRRAPAVPTVQTQERYLAYVNTLGLAPNSYFYDP